MGTALELEEFDVFRPGPEPTPATAQTEMEEQRLQSFEQGYKAGWDDATKAQTDDKARVSADLERNLQTLSFTFHEARSQMLRDLKPLLTEMVSKVLSKTAFENLPEIVAGNVMEIAKTHLDTRIELVAAPKNRLALETLLNTQSNLPVQITEEASLGEGQVYLRFADSEQHFDLDAVTRQVSQIVADFYELQEKAG